MALSQATPDLLPRQATSDQWPVWLTTRWHAANVTAIVQSRQWLRASHAVGSQAKTPQHETPLSFGLTLEMHHAVLLERASLRPSRLWVYFPRCNRWFWSPLPRYCRSVLLICPHPRGYYHGNCSITAVAVTGSFTSVWFKSRYKLVDVRSSSQSCCEFVCLHQCTHCLCTWLWSDISSVEWDLITHQRLIYKCVHCSVQRVAQWSQHC